MAHVNLNLKTTFEDAVNFIKKNLVDPLAYPAIAFIPMLAQRPTEAPNPINQLLCSSGLIIAFFASYWFVGRGKK